MKKANAVILAVGAVVIAAALIGWFFAGPMAPSDGRGDPSGQPTWYDGPMSNWIEIHFEGVPEDAETTFYFGGDQGQLDEYTAYGPKYNFIELDPGDYLLDFGESVSGGDLYCPATPGLPMTTPGGQVVVEYVLATGDSCDA
ncbi:MAG: hypothetical protein LBR58_09970 [Propionibacteriaceae bacterium]|jgi:hypothetical protein|nr:hypothetical protein [Propionibacteriaceae bacterium]